jgi:hypothetical protein
MDVFNLVSAIHDSVVSATESEGIRTQSLIADTINGLLLNGPVDNTAARNIVADYRNNPNPNNDLRAGLAAKWKALVLDAEPEVLALKEKLANSERFHAEMTKSRDRYKAEQERLIDEQGALKVKLRAKDGELREARAQVEDWKGLAMRNNQRLDERDVRIDRLEQEAIARDDLVKQLTARLEEAAASLLETKREAHMAMHTAQQDETLEALGPYTLDTFLADGETLKTLRKSNGTGKTYLPPSGTVTMTLKQLSPEMAGFVVSGRIEPAADPLFLVTDGSEKPLLQPATKPSRLDVEAGKTFVVLCLDGEHLYVEDVSADEGVVYLCTRADAMEHASRLAAVSAGDGEALAYYVANVHSEHTAKVKSRSRML